MVISERQTGSKRLSEIPWETVKIPSVQVILARNGKDGLELFLVHRIPGGGFPNQWTSPGGRRDIGEKPKETGVRETNEEVGVLIKNKRKLVFFRSINSPTKRKEHNAVYDYKIRIYVVFGENLSPFNNSPAELDKAEWIPIGDALKMHKEAVEKVKKSGEIIDRDKIPDALAPRTYEIIQALYNCPLANGKIPTEASRLQ
jgi:8-oxo-dGTP pyrophosphatase MutT (NUDIX family)